MSLYSKRGVSAQKEEVHKATEHLDQGLFPLAFCKVYPDFLMGDPSWVNLMHADGAGTKSILAYLYWKETGDLDVWKGIARDAVAMNLDDLLCVGVHDRLLFSSTIDRNKRIIPGEVLKAIIEGTQEFFDELKGYGITIHYLGGETADVGDVVRTIAVNGTMSARWPREKLVTNESIRAGDLIVGLASFGRANYENEYNSGIGSNGLTSARHDLLRKSYASEYPESFDTRLDEEVVYIGRHRLTDPWEWESDGSRTQTTIGKLVLSPTRTYAPVLKELLESMGGRIHGLIHCSGGGQTKCLKYLPAGLRVVKDNLFSPPPVFQLIREASGADDREMYQVFNMGHRMEIFLDPADADQVLQTAAAWGIQARVVGRVEASQKKQLLIKLPDRELSF